MFLSLFTSNNLVKASKVYNSNFSVDNQVHGPVFQIRRQKNDLDDFSIHNVLLPLGLFVLFASEKKEIKIILKFILIKIINLPVKVDDNLYLLQIHDV